jgi:hypothetical protein
MNKYNIAFKSRIDNASRAMEHLIKNGCAIVSLSITDRYTEIEILPPLTPKVKGTLISINNTHKGRHHLMATRLHGCTITWQLNQDELTKMELRA